MRATFRMVLNLFLAFSSIGACLAADPPEPASSAVGHAHMDTSCSRAASLKFDEGIALLHNFWYPRALSTFDQVIQKADEPGQRQLAKEVLTIEAKEAQAVAARASGDPSKAVAMMDAAAAIEDSIYALSQPPYPPIPVHEMYGTMLLEMNRPAQALEQFAKSLSRTPGRPKAIFGLARAAQTLGDYPTAAKQYESFLRLWKSADPDRPEVVSAKQFLASNPDQSR
jgi:tetratricopeptide (TPR) repeat protein